MASFVTEIGVGDQNHPIYEVMINDGDIDGGQNIVHTIMPRVSWPATLEDIETAIQAFADSLASVQGATLVSIKKYTTTETVL